MSVIEATTKEPTSVSRVCGEKGFSLTERVKKLKERCLSATRVLSGERCWLLTESFKETDGQPIEIRRAKAFEKIPLNILASPNTTKPNAIRRIKRSKLNTGNAMMKTLTIIARIPRITSAILTQRGGLISLNESSTPNREINEIFNKLYCWN